MTHQELVNLAIKDLQEGRLHEAEIRFNYLLSVKPDHPDLWFYTATTFMKRGFNVVAEELLKKCLQLDPDNIASYSNLGYICKDELRYDEAETYFKKAISIAEGGISKKELSIMWSNLGTLFVNAGEPNKAIEYCNKAAELDPDNVYAHWNASLAYLELGEWEKGWKEYEYGFNHHEKRKDKQYGGLPKWDGTPGQTVIVYGEQGIGDEIMFMSMLHEMSEKCRIIYDCHPRLADIARNSFEFPIYGTRKTETPWQDEYEADSRIAIGSLGQYFRLKSKDFPKEPYLKCDPELKQKYIQPKDKLNIGISWKGGYKHTRKDLRSVSLEDLKPILEMDANFISLQYTEGAQDELDEFEKATGIHLEHNQDVINDYDHTAALVSNLDLVISVCTSVIHLSGAMGVPCWVLTPSRPAWRYLVNGPMPWYGSVRLFRQPKDDWEPVIKQVKSELWNLLQKNIAA